MSVYQYNNQINYQNYNNIISYFNYKKNKELRKLNTNYSQNNLNNQDNPRLLTKINNIIEKDSTNNDDQEIITILLDQLHIFYNLKPNLKLSFLNSKNIIKEFKEIHNYSLGVYLLEGYIVKKIIKNNALGNFMLRNEVNGLSKLNKYSHFPKLLGYFNNSIFMTYCGEKITSKNIPDNWQEQIEEIEMALTNAKTNPDDMIQRNICVLNNTIYIIDFGLNTSFTSPIKLTIKKLYNLLDNLYKNKYYN